MIMKWLLTQTLGMTRFGWLLIAVGILVFGGYLIASSEREDDKANQTIGATVQQNTDLREVVKRTEEGNAAREEIRKPDRIGACVRYDQCVRSSRPSAASNCVRFLPTVAEGFGCPGTLTGSGRPGE